MIHFFIGTKAQFIKLGLFLLRKGEYNKKRNSD